MSSTTWIALGAVASGAGAAASAAVAVTTQRLARRAGEQAVLALTLSAAAREQADSVRDLADMSAESIRLATGSFVFELRDRFDADLSGVRVGLSGVEWLADNPAGLAGSVAPGPVETLVLHRDDRVWCRLRISVGQSVERRNVTGSWTQHPSEPDCSALAVLYGAQQGSRSDAESFELPPDTVLFVDFVLELNAGSLAPGRFQRRASGMVDITNTRTEGACARIPVEIVLLGVAAAEEDGIALSGLDADAVVGREERTYLLDKEHAVPLVFPTALTPAGRR